MCTGRQIVVGLQSNTVLNSVVPATHYTFFFGIQIGSKKNLLMFFALAWMTTRSQM